MKIRLILPSIVSLLALLLLAIGAYDVYEAMQRRAEATAFVAYNALSTLLLVSTGDWAVERGLSNAALAATEPATTTTFDEIRKRRASADQAFKDALSGIREVPAMRPAQQAIADAEQAFAALQVLRLRADEDLAKGAA